MKPLDYNEVKSAIDSIEHHGLEINVLLDRPQSDMNIAHIFRLADSADIKKVFILNPAFHLNWQKIEKLSRKNSRHIPFFVVQEISELEVPEPLIALEWTDTSSSVFDFTVDYKKMTLVIGNEQNGIQEALLKQCQTSIHIPMYGLHSSMNMAMATSVAIYQLISKAK